MGMMDVLRKRWRYFTAKTDSKFEASADPKIQLEQAIADAQDQHRRLVEQAANVVANQKQHQPQTSPTGEKRTEFGGVIYAESAEKAARFIMDCNQNLIPLVFIHDVNGFMVGRDAEWSGIIRAGAKMVSAVSNSSGVAMIPSSPAKSNSVPRSKPKASTSMPCAPAWRT